MQEFGGSWTEAKLDCVERYLKEYIKILSKYGYKYAYIDAFAGTGYRKGKMGRVNEPFFPELGIEESKAFVEGSVYRALKLEPGFDKYIFIEKDKEKCEELEALKKEYDSKKIEVINYDANNYLQQLCSYNWKSHRAVLFLDPFGMQVEWATIEMIARTKAIDMWILFPLGIGVGRLLKKDGQIEPSWKRKLDSIFGTNEWFGEFYDVSVETDLFGNYEQTKKIVDFETISSFFIKRLKSVFPGVAKPAMLCNSKSNPMFILCFASANPKGSKTAIKIANHLLKRIQ